jgi:uncharacterized protein (UPF0261 family)
MMRAFISLVLLLTVVGCTTLRRSKVGPQVLAAYPYAADVSIPEVAGHSRIWRRLLRETAHAIRKATRSRRIRTDADRRATMIDALGTMVPGQAPQVR